MPYGLGSYFKERTKKVFSLTPEERGYVKKIKTKIKSTPKTVKKYGSRIDFGRLYGAPLRKQVPIKKRKKTKATKFVVIKGIRYKKLKIKKKKK